MRILILGSSGLLGSTLTPNLKKSHHQIITHSHQSGSTDVLADITDLNATESILNMIDPDIIINLICLSNVDACEEDPEKAYKLNVLTTFNVTQCLYNVKHRTQLIQISTDQVYDGMGPQKEEEVKIVNHYAKTKYESEKIAMNTNSTVLRTNFFGKSKSSSLKSFSDWIIESIDNKDIKFFNDVYFSPLNMGTLSQVILKIIDLGLKKNIYNLGSKIGMSKFDFATIIAEKLNVRLELERSVSIDDVKLIASRPRGMMLDSSKFEEDFNIPLPNLKDEIDKIF